MSIETTKQDRDWANKINQLERDIEILKLDLYNKKTSDALGGTTTITTTSTVTEVDASAIHTNTAGEISGLTEKTVIVDADLLLIEDSADSNNKKKVQVTNIVDSLAGEIEGLISHDNIGGVSTSDHHVATVNTDITWNASTVSQAEAEAGIATTDRKWTALRVAQAIAALETGGFTPALVTAHSDVSNAGSGAIITSTERAALHDEYIDQNAIDATEGVGVVAAAMDDHFLFTNTSGSNNLQRALVSAIFELGVQTELQGVAGAVIAASDAILFLDATDSNTLKQETLQHMNEIIFHNSLDGIDAGDINHLTDAQVTALHAEVDPFPSGQFLLDGVSSFINSSAVVNYTTDGWMSVINTTAAAAYYSSKVPIPITLTINGVTKWLRITSGTLYWYQQNAADDLDEIYIYRRNMTGTSQVIYSDTTNTGVAGYNNKALSGFNASYYTLSSSYPLFSFKVKRVALASVTNFRFIGILLNYEYA